MRAYLANIGMTVREFAEGINCNAGYLSNIINGHHMAGPRLAKDIFEATDGVVQVPTKQRRKRHDISRTG
ncbi:MAG: helix-turn-helix domain-containing protein [Nitrososphaerales archaeon]